MTDQQDALEAISLAADELVPQLAERLRTHGLAEIEVSRGELRLRVSATPGAPSPAPRPAVDASGGVAPATPAAGAGPGAAGTTGAAGSVGVASPAVGYFVYADGLGPGLEVARGDALGHVEMLGVRHDVRAPRSGTVQHLVAEAGEAVEYGQVVLELDPSGSAA
jgi:biotin carboxyl carrier protein